MVMGFFKSTRTIDQGLQSFSQMIHQVRKIRLMGAASLDVVYVASGRFDAYVEYGIKLWDIAAGQLILEKRRWPTWRANPFPICTPLMCKCGMGKYRCGNYWNRPGPEITVSPQTTAYFFPIIRAQNPGGAAICVTDPRHFGQTC